MSNLDQIHADASSIFKHALKACDIPAAFDRHLRFEDKKLVRQLSPRVKPVTISLDPYKKFLVIAFGKAALTIFNRLMAAARTAIAPVV